ncbi:MAG: cytochrome c [Deltaproteobacteria bacterium]|nr:cytochrome c [Deltaproteobacteria bacterium]
MNHRSVLGCLALCLAACTPAPVVEVPPPSPQSSGAVESVVTEPTVAGLDVMAADATPSGNAADPATSPLLSTDASTSPDVPSVLDARAELPQPPAQTTPPRVEPSRPPVPRPTVRPTPTVDPDLAQGRELFNRTCGRCHPGGASRVGPRLIGRNDSAAHVRSVVRDGQGTMRAIPASRVSDADLSKILVYLRSINAAR